MFCVKVSPGNRRSREIQNIAHDAGYRWGNPFWTIPQDNHRAWLGFCPERKMIFTIDEAILEHGKIYPVSYEEAKANLSQKQESVEKVFYTDVTPETSEALQLFAFKHGWTWYAGGTNVKYLEYNKLKFRPNRRTFDASMTADNKWKHISLDNIFSEIKKLSAEWLGLSVEVIKEKGTVKIGCCELQEETYLLLKESIKHYRIAGQTGVWILPDGVRFDGKLYKFEELDRLGELIKSMGGPV